MFVNFDAFNFGFEETYSVIIETYIGNQCVQRQSLNAPESILKAQFMGLIQQIAQENRPMRVKMIVPEVIWDDIEKKQKVMNNYVEFKNKLMEG